MNKNRETIFRFKQFSLSNRLSAMKVGTDGVLLGGWAQLPADSPEGRVLDVGCGTGVVALMLAQRYPEATVRCIDINADAVAECAGNIAASPFSGRVEVSQADFLTLASDEALSGAYDLIVSNPPFFTERLHSPDADRATARHDDTLPLRALLSVSAKLLRSGGMFAMVFPAVRDEEVLFESSLAGLHPTRRCHVFTRAGKPARRTLWQFSTNPAGTCAETDLVISNPDNSYTPAYISLLKDFYLNF